MKTNRKLAEKIIGDLAGIYQPMHGFSFAHPDRLTREEAQRLADWARGHPDVSRALRDRGDPDHAAVRLFGDVVAHFLVDHPQDASGQPSAWPARPPAGQPTADNPFADLHPDEAEALMAWVQTRQEFAASYYDAAHPQHSAYVNQMLQLREIAGGAHGDPDGGNQAQATTMDQGRIAELRAAIGRLEAEPAYWDRNHPDHAATVRDMTRLYEQMQPQRPGAAARGEALDPFRDAMVRHKVAQLEKDPAYHSAAHPEHAARVSEMAELYGQLHPQQVGSPAGRGGTVDGSTGSQGLRHYQPSAASGEAHWKGEIARIEQLPEFRDGSHPAHADAVNAMTAAYEGLHPPPAETP